jgi:predicted deacetylase
MSRYLPELHDVHPGTLRDMASLLALLPPAAQRCAAVLAVPRWMGGEPVEADPACVAWLRERAGRVVLHGLTHAAPPSLWSVALAGSRNDAEFARARLGDAETMIATGRAALARTVGRQPEWFCAPRWEQRDETAAALCEAGFRGWMLRDRLVLATGRTLPVPALWFDDGERAWVRLAARARRARRTARLLSERAPFRLALHPRDLSAPGVLHEIRELLGTLDAEGWTPASLDELAAPRSGTAPEGASP